MKRNYFALVTLMFIILFSSAHAQKNKQQILDGLFTKNGEIYFSFQIFDRDEIPVLTRIISIDNVKGNEVYAYANRKEFGNFLDLGYPYTILPHPGTLLSESELNMGGNQRSPHSGTVWNFYPTYSQYVAYMVAFASDHPAICRLDTLGTTKQGRLLLAVKLSDSVNVNRGKPEFFYTSSMHGDETTGYILMLHLIDSLLSGYESVPRITNLLNNYQIYINPLANPDGTYHGGNNTVIGATRYNANGVDLNRNFPDPAAGPHPDGNAWQLETKAFMHYDTIHHFVMSANFHGGAEVVNYPWDTWLRIHADDSWFRFVSREYADTIHLHSPSGYFTDLINGITNGYAWYTITGGRQDYTTYFHFGREVTIELSSDKLLPAGQLINYWNYNKRSLLNYIEECSYGINGQVTDTVTGNPIKAKVFITLHDIDNSFQYSDTASGWYYRPIAQGNWALTFTCLGYYPKTINGISVSNRNTTRLNVRMIPIGFGIQSETQKEFPIVYPNPSNGNINLLLPESGTSSFTFTIFDITGRLIQSGTIDRAGDKVVYQLDLTRLQKGIYLLKLDDGKSVYENKLIIQ
ncbi:MAG TPA: M14 family zinc carboxypeptidase [Bacteroidales bacterium]|nr:M14 family zinc carboxypeptidase [Bacteroidales bacterium]